MSVYVLYASIPLSLILEVVIGRRDHIGSATGAEIYAGSVAYRTTVSIRMSPLLICPQLAVNCVGESGERKKERDFWTSSHSLLPSGLELVLGFHQ